MCRTRTTLIATSIIFQLTWFEKKIETTSRRITSLILHFFSWQKLLRLLCAASSLLVLPGSSCYFLGGKNHENVRGPPPPLQSFAQEIADQTKITCENNHRTMIPPKKKTVTSWEKAVAFGGVGPLRFLEDLVGRFTNYIQYEMPPGSHPTRSTLHNGIPYSHGQGETFGEQTTNVIFKLLLE